MSLRKVIWTPKVALCIGGHAGPNGDNGWEVAFDVVFGIRPWAYALCIGWGYDDPVPLRPWPQGWWKRTTKRKNVTSGLAWLGFFANIGTTA